MKNYIEIYLNNKKIDLEYEFKEKGVYKILIKRPLTNTNYIFSNCSSLISLSLFNFNTNNVKDMSYMF